MVEFRVNNVGVAEDPDSLLGVFLELANVFVCVVGFFTRTVEFESEELCFALSRIAR